ncbi:protein FAR1-RELATED SEQUENCE 7-like [Rhododendron vialii]|uniref:protein FAR1-RELATED SEQUENCE 7-like n=1 Tax=Rhododendron vialii TaxID=182163 RepID=UPI00265D86AD|nr:protein FAR1-RELATED SEQUENCE 7-like [Rhododendron vialii]
MGGRPPTSIITDQDLAMKGAIAQVFPNTRHRLCLWHIKKKFVEKLSQVPVYNRGTFFAGMNTTGRSKGVNSFFDAFVTSTTNLKEFVVKYDQALKRIDNEFLLKHAAKVYTRNIFNKFKDEISEAFNYKVEEMTNADGFQSFVVKSKVNELQKFTVTLDSQTYEGMCECQYFEFVGILCRHIFKVFVRLDIDAIPDHFILPR